MLTIEAAVAVIIAAVIAATAAALEATRQQHAPAPVPVSAHSRRGRR